jgi:hypothetical protein
MELDADRLVDLFASRHHGLVTREAALRCGLTSGQIHRRLRSGRLIRVAPSVYRVASAPVTWRQTALAACLAAPPGTVVSHLSAAALYELANAPVRPQLTLPPGASARSGTGRVHRSPVTIADRSAVDGLPTTAVTRTLIDCAGIVGFRRLCDMVDTAFVAGLSHQVAIAPAIDRAQDGRGRKGVAALRRAVEAWTPGITPGSPAEMRLLRKITEVGLEPPERQIILYDADGVYIGRVDLGWPQRRRGFEYDSDLHHNPRHWERDESRQLRYAAIGWGVVRVGKPDLLPSVAWLDDHLRALARSWAA